MAELHLRYYIPTEEDTRAACEISAWIGEHPDDMVHRSSDELLEMFTQRRSVIVQRELETGEWENAGHFAFTVIEGDHAEAGALVTPKKLQGMNGLRRDVAQFAVEALLGSDLQPQVADVYAFTLLENRGSTQVFESTSGRLHIDPMLAPDVFFEESIGGEGRKDYHGFYFRRGIRDGGFTTVENQITT